VAQLRDRRKQNGQLGKVEGSGLPKLEREERNLEFRDAIRNFFNSNQNFQNKRFLPKFWNFFFTFKIQMYHEKIVVFVFINTNFSLL
jgi:hypothetical protein